MSLLKRLLGGSGCRFWGGTGRRRIGASRNWAVRRQNHVESCVECRGRQQRERQYLERLRGAAVPEASKDLTARLLAQTEKLAKARADTEQTHTEQAATERTDTEHADTERAETIRVETERADTVRVDTAPGAAHRASSERLPAEPSAARRAALAGTAGTLAGGPAAAAPLPAAHRRGPRLPALAAGGAVAALALVAGTAYFMGSDPAVPAEGTEASAFARSDTTGLPATGDRLGAEELFGAGQSGSADVAGEGTSPRVAFGLGAEPDFTPAGALSAGQLAALRSQGWTCPELQELGYHLLWARAGVLGGDEVLELRLTDGRHFATVLEQHVSPPPTPGVPTAPRAENSPVNVLTGHAAAADGFTPADSGALPSAAVPGDGALWVNTAPPYRAIYQTATATYTYISDLPAEQADDGAAALTRVSSDHPALASRDGVPERIERGLSRILEHLAP